MDNIASRYTKISYGNCKTKIYVVTRVKLQSFIMIEHRYFWTGMVGEKNQGTNGNLWRGNVGCDS